MDQDDTQPPEQKTHADQQPQTPEQENHAVQQAQPNRPKFQAKVALIERVNDLLALVRDDTQGNAGYLSKSKDMHFKYQEEYQHRMTVVDKILAQIGIQDEDNYAALQSEHEINGDQNIALRDVLRQISLRETFGVHRTLGSLYSSEFKSLKAPKLEEHKVVNDTGETITPNGSVFVGSWFFGLDLRKEGGKKSFEGCLKHMAKAANTYANVLDVAELQEAETHQKGASA